MLYAQLIYFETEEFHSTTATKVPDVQKLVEAGYEYVCEMETIKLFRKRKYLKTTLFQKLGIHPNAGDVCQKAGDRN